MLENEPVSHPFRALSPGEVQVLTQAARGHSSKMIAYALGVTPPTVLSEAERDVLDLLQRGLSNEQIASARSRSVRTIANQVASLLRKTSSASRRELLVLGRPPRAEAV